MCLYLYKSRYINLYLEHKETFQNYYHKLIWREKYIIDVFSLVELLPGLKSPKLESAISQQPGYLLSWTFRVKPYSSDEFGNKNMNQLLIMMFWGLDGFRWNDPNTIHASHIIKFRVALSDWLLVVNDQSQDNIKSWLTILSVMLENDVFRGELVDHGQAQVVHQIGFLTS